MRAQLVVVERSRGRAYAEFFSNSRPQRCSHRHVAEHDRIGTARVASSGAALNVRFAAHAPLDVHVSITSLSSSKARCALRLQSAISRPKARGLELHALELSIDLRRRGCFNTTRTSSAFFAQDVFGLQRRDDLNTTSTRRVADHHQSAFAGRAEPIAALLAVGGTARDNLGLTSSRSEHRLLLTASRQWSSGNSACLRAAGRVEMRVKLNRMPTEPRPSLMRRSARRLLFFSAITTEHPALPKGRRGSACHLKNGVAPVLPLDLQRRAMHPHPPAHSRARLGDYRTLHRIEIRRAEAKSATFSNSIERAAITVTWSRSRVSSTDPVERDDSTRLDADVPPVRRVTELTRSCRTPGVSSLISSVNRRLMRSRARVRRILADRSRFGDGPDALS